MKAVLCFGEILLRLSPQLGGQWLEENRMSVFAGGAELNAAIGLAHFGVPVSYMSAAPDNYLTQEMMQYVSRLGVDTSRMHLSGSRIGTYYLAQGTDLKSAGVIYDRAHSSFSELQPGQIDWQTILENVDWVHMSAISPALTANTAAVCLEAVTSAAEKNIPVSIDLNFRAKLWQYGRQPIEVMPAIVEKCELIMGNIWAAEKMLGVKIPGSMVPGKHAFIETAERSSEEIMRQFARCRRVANTFRFDNDGSLNYYATLYEEGKLFVSKEHTTTHVLDRVGSGDTFMAGLIYGVRNRLASEDLIDFAAAAAFNKLFITGDASTATVTDIYNKYL